MLLFGFNCRAGMQAVQDAVSCWEDGLEKLDGLDDSEYVS